jgi:hypothetical protein
MLLVSPLSFLEPSGHQYLVAQDPFGVVNPVPEQYLPAVQFVQNVASFVPSLYVPILQGWQPVSPTKHPGPHFPLSIAAHVAANKFAHGIIIRKNMAKILLCIIIF